MSFVKQKTTAIVAGDPIDPNFGESTRQNDIAAAFFCCYFGGSRDIGMLAAATPDTLEAWNYLDLEIDGTYLAQQTNGCVWEAMVDVKTSNAGTSIEPKVYDSTNPASLVLLTTTGGSASTSTSWVRQTLVLPTLASAVKNYRLRFAVSNPTNQVWGIGYLRRRVP